MTNETYISNSWKGKREVNNAVKSKKKKRTAHTNERK